jgi:DNA-directed RNA polymerase specialized sigma subunit
MTPENIPNQKKYHSNETEWLMQPNATANDFDDDIVLYDAIAETVASMDATDQQMIYLIYYERKTFQEAAREVGISAKSHAWRKTKSAVNRLEILLKQNPIIMEILNNKYGIIGDQ